MTSHNRLQTSLINNFQITEEQADVLIAAGLHSIKLARAVSVSVLLALGFNRAEITRIKGL